MVLLAVPAFAAETVTFVQSQFVAAQKEGRPILVDIRASWCPTCAAQKPILERLTAKPEFKNLVVFTVDFDTQKDVVREFHAQMQSTLIAFKGTTETVRSVGDTEERSIEKLLRSTEG
ncbi:MAG TPA: thioredoxin family protein [Candidatus Binataceae bacterium]|nr:thioredoxin family protein [Candidatus Binataceae bacterium]